MKTRVQGRIRTRARGRIRTRVRCRIRTRVRKLTLDSVGTFFVQICFSRTSRGVKLVTEISVTKPFLFQLTCTLN